MSESAHNAIPNRDDREGRITDVPETRDFVFNQTMLRIKEPQRSLDFYTRVLGLTLIKQIDFPEMAFSLFFLGYLRDDAGDPPRDPKQRTAFTFRQPALLELTHNWGTEADENFKGYHDGNSEPQGFGHIGFAVPDVGAACERFERLGVSFVKRPDDGKMKGLAFIRDPDGYWIEILEAESLANLADTMGRI